MRYLKETCQALLKHTKKRMTQGQVRLHIGMRGHLVLMMDKIDRLLKDPQQSTEEEITNLASDALIVMWEFVKLSMEEVEEGDDDDE